MRIEAFNPARLDIARVGRQIEETGARYVVLGNGFEHPLNLVFIQSLLGERLGMGIRSEELSPTEHLLLKKGNNFWIITLCDMDGVLVSPMQAVCGDRNERKIPLERFRWLRLLIKASDAVALLTSRVDPGPLREKYPPLKGIIDKFQNTVIDTFPFLDGASVTRLERWGRGKLVVEAGKSFVISARSKQLKRVIEESLKSLAQGAELPFIVYIIGSSIFDRRSVLRLCLANPQLAPRVVYFDTGHLIL